jgi:hypothetical protein
MKNPLIVLAFICVALLGYIAYHMGLNQPKKAPVAQIESSPSPTTSHENASESNTTSTTSTVVIQAQPQPIVYENDSIAPAVITGAAVLGGAAIIAENESGGGTVNVDKNYNHTNWSSDHQSSTSIEERHQTNAADDNTLEERHEASTNHTERTSRVDERDRRIE